MTACRLPVDERRAQIMDAVLPVIREHGAGVTSRQLAEAAGVAEGTIFRSFGSKDALLAEVFQREGERAYSLAAIEIDPRRPLGVTVQLLVDLIVEQMGELMRLALVLGRIGRDPEGDARANERYGAFMHDIVRHLEPYRDELRLDPARSATVLSTLAIAASSDWGQPTRPLPPEAALDVLLNGIALSQT